MKGCDAARSYLNDLVGGEVQLLLFEMSQRHVSGTGISLFLPSVNSHPGHCSFSVVHNPTLLIASNLYFISLYSFK